MTSNETKAYDLHDTKMADAAKLFVVKVDYGDYGPFDTVYGYDPIVFTDENKADDRADELSTGGDWGKQPTYHVEETTFGELRSTFAIALDRGIA